MNFTIVWEDAYDRRRAYEEKNREARRQSRRSWNSEHRKTNKARRPSKDHPMRGAFIAWDGEGYTDKKGKHYYSLLACSDGTTLVAPEAKSLTRAEVFEAFIQAKIKYPEGINVIFGGNYDFNMILKSNGLHRWYAEQLYRGKKVWLDGYQVKWIDGKMLTIKKDGVSVTIYDVFQFFQRSFLKACEEYLGEDYPHRDLITSMKAQRVDFSYADLPEVIEYNKAELEVLVLLMNELRRRLDDADIPIGQWYGPGSIASQLLKRYGIKKCMLDTYTKHPDVSLAAQYAYSGGRFEIIKCGHVDRPAYEYDINSAYPHAMTKLPDLQKGEWKHYAGDPGYRDFAVYRVQSIGTGSDEDSHRPQPLWSRTERGVFYSSAGVNGWYWTPDVECLRDSNHSYAILEAWVYEPYDDSKPFSFVSELYEKRLALKEAGNGAHVGIKLGLNSLYGKMAQQVGWYATEEGIQLPPYHQLEWAGYITAHCRWMIWQAIKNNLSDIIAIETDAVFSAVPLPVDVGKGLGQWEETRFASLTYCNSGIYWAETLDGKKIQKSRGFHPKYITRDDAVDALSNGVEQKTAPTTLFITLGNALNTNYWAWCKWVKAEREIQLTPNDPGQKRSHDYPCPSCSPPVYTKAGALKQKAKFTIGAWHATICYTGVFLGIIPSSKFHIEWLDGPKVEDDDDEIGWR